jgi:hypothetical protein
VTSAPGNGSRFRFTIPRAETDTNREMERCRSTSPTIGYVDEFENERPGLRQLTRS